MFLRINVYQFIDKFLICKRKFDFLFKTIYMKLCIISHTEHYENKNKELVSWGATVTEINYLTNIFDEIYHIAMYYEEEPPSSSLPYTSDKIKLVRIPVLGGKTFKDKLKIISNIPKVINIVNGVLKKVDYYQLRCPTGIGVFLIPYLNLFTRKQGWYKYAGNWNQQNPPLGYLIQRSLLKHQSKKVTINGKWHDQPDQCYTFENPTLLDSDLKEGMNCTKNKNYSGKISFCFVGRLERKKGVESILKAINSLKETSRIGKVHFVGDGEELSYFKDLAKQNNVNVIFHGGLPREEVFHIYKMSHAFLLPSTASEGFPKVIAEALCYGCLPIVSNVSAIGQYINNTNGVLINEVTVENLTNELTKVLEFSQEDFEQRLFHNSDVVNKFTYSYYNSRIKNEILDDVI